MKVVKFSAFALFLLHGVCVVSVMFNTTSALNSGVTDELLFFLLFLSMFWAGVYLLVDNVMEERQAIKESRYMYASDRVRIRGFLYTAMVCLAACAILVAMVMSI